MRDKLLLKLPGIAVSILGILSVYLTIRATINYFFLMSAQFKGVVPSFILFGDSTEPGRIGFWLSAICLIVGWLISTKFKAFQTKRWRIAWFGNMALGMFFHFLWLISAPVYNTLIPYLGNRINQMDVQSIWLEIAVGDTQTLLLTVMFVPTTISCVSMLWLFGQYSQYSKELNQAFWEFEYKNVHLQKFFKMSKKELWPDVVLGPDSDTKEMVVQPGKDRTLNNVIIGSIGTGKTAALVLPIINQDLHWMSRYINEYPSLYQREDFHTEDVKGMYLNGVSIIEPSNDLCQKAFQLVKAHGIPEESVFYIDPTNPNTPSINPMEGPVDKVAEAFAMVIEGLAEGGQANFFFQQSERNHLKHYIYLLKLHEPEQEVTFDMLLKMYDNPNLVRVMHEKLKKTFPENVDLMEDRDERNHWAIVKQMDEWFDTNLLPKTERAGQGNVPKLVQEGEFRGQQEYYDAKTEYVQGLRNILNDIGASPLIRRVLFGKSDFSFDRHLESGGVLLVNSAKGELGGLSNVLGKLVLLSLQNAVFRRKPNISNFHHILVDEFPDYIYKPFKEFPAQSRKYKVIVTVVAQTVAQLADKYGETYMHTLLGTLRHKMVYGDIPDFDAQLFSKIFGEVERFEEGVNEQAVSPLQEKPMLRVGNSYQKKKEAILSPSDIIFQNPFQCAVKIVANNKPVPVMQIDANFVPKEEFNEAVIQVNEEAAKTWLESRKGIVLLTENQTLEEFEVLDEEEVIKELEKSDIEQAEPLLLNPGNDHPITLPIFNKKDSDPEGEIPAGVSSDKLEAVPEDLKKNTDAIEPIVPLSPANLEDIKTEPPSNSVILSSDDGEPTVNVLSKEMPQGLPKERINITHESDSNISNKEVQRPVLSQLGEKQEQLQNELLKELSEIPAKSEVAVASETDKEAKNNSKKAEILFSVFEE